MSRPSVALLSRDAAIARRRRVIVALIASQIHGTRTEVPVGPDEGLEYDSVLAIDDLYTITTGRLVGRRRGTPVAPSAWDAPEPAPSAGAVQVARALGDEVMKLEYDPQADAAYVRLRVAAVASTEEIEPGVFMDVAADGWPVGFELLDASEVLDGPSQGVTFELLSRALATRG